MAFESLAFAGEIIFKNLDSSIETGLLGLTLVVPFESKNERSADCFSGENPDPIDGDAAGIGALPPPRTGLENAVASNFFVSSEILVFSEKLSVT